MGCLNKLSDNNFEVILGRLIAVLRMRAARVQDMASAVLVKCYHDDCYAALYVRMLTSIKSSLPEAECDVSDFNSTIDEFATEVASGLTTEVVHAMEMANAASKVKGSGSKLGSPEYDLFCRATKARKLVIGKHRTLLLLLRDEAAPLWPRRGIHDHLVWVCDQVRTSPHTPMPEVLDVWLDMLHDAVKALPRAVNADETRCVMDAVSQERMAAVSSRSKFKALDIAQCLLRSKPQSRPVSSATAAAASTNPLRSVARSGCGSGGGGAAARGRGGHQAPTVLTLLNRGGGSSSLRRW
jgi:hypothetical protein